MQPGSSYAEHASSSQLTATASGDAQQQAMVTRVLAKAACGTLRPEDLMPASTRWARQTDAAVDKLHRAAQEVLSVSAPGTALARDAAFLAAAVAAAADERQRVPLQQALDSLQRTSGKLLLPQVLLLSSKTAGVWGMHCTAHLAADSNAAPFIDKMRRSFHLSVKQQHLSSEQAQLRREGDALPSLDHVELQHDTATAVAAPVPAPGKAQPPSKRRRTALQELWHVLLPILVAMGACSL